MDDQCSHIEKIAEGGFNKVFLLRSESGREVIARIPTPIAGPPRYTTASEAATRSLGGFPGSRLPRSRPSTSSYRHLGTT